MNELCEQSSGKSTLSAKFASVRSHHSKINSRSIFTSSVKGRRHQMKHKFLTLLLILITAFSVVAQTPQPKVASSAAATVQVRQASVRQHMEALASDKMKGRGSATADEFAAANYIASELKRFKIEPAGDKGGYIQRVALDNTSHGDTQTGAQKAFTSNVVGILRGSDPQLSKEAVLLSAHLDHLGIGPAVNRDSIYNGAADDASGVP